MSPWLWTRNFLQVLFIGIVSTPLECEGFETLNHAIISTVGNVGILQDSGEASQLADKENNKVTLLLDSTLCFVIHYFLYISLATDRADPYRVGPFLGSTQAPLAPIQCTVSQLVDKLWATPLAVACLILTERATWQVWVGVSVLRTTREGIPHLDLTLSSQSRWSWLRNCFRTWSDMLLLSTRRYLSRRQRDILWHFQRSYRT